MLVEERVREILNNSKVLDVPIDTVHIDDDLEQYGMNSIRWVKALVTLEKEFGIQFDDSYLMKEKNNTMNELVRYVEAAVVT